MKRYAYFLGFVTTLLFSAPGLGETATELGAFLGVWEAPPGGNQEILTLRSEGSTILGQYAFISQTAEHYEGTLEGTVQGRQFEGRWQEHPRHQPAALTQGRFSLTLRPEGNRLEGWYGPMDGLGRTPWIMQRPTPP